MKTLGQYLLLSLVFVSLFARAQLANLDRVLLYANGEYVFGSSWVPGPDNDIPIYIPRAYFIREDSLTFSVEDHQVIARFRIEPSWQGIQRAIAGRWKNVGRVPGYIDAFHEVTGTPIAQKYNFHCRAITDYAPDSDPAVLEEADYSQDFEISIDRVWRWPLQATSREILKKLVNDLNVKTLGSIDYHFRAFSEGKTVRAYTSAPVFTVEPSEESDQLESNPADAATFWKKLFRLTAD